MFLYPVLMNTALFSNSLEVDDILAYVCLPMNIGGIYNSILYAINSQYSWSNYSYQCDLNSIFWIIHYSIKQHLPSDKPYIIWVLILFFTKRIFNEIQTPFSEFMNSEWLRQKCQESVGRWTGYQWKPPHPKTSVSVKIYLG